MKPLRNAVAPLSDATICVLEARPARLMPSLSASFGIAHSPVSCPRPSRDPPSAPGGPGRDHWSGPGREIQTVPGGLVFGESAVVIDLVGKDPVPVPGNLAHLEPSASGFFGQWLSSRPAPTPDKAGQRIASRGGRTFPPDLAKWSPNHSKSHATGQVPIPGIERTPAPTTPNSFSIRARRRETTMLSMLASAKSATTKSPAIAP